MVLLSGWTQPSENVSPFSASPFLPWVQEDAREKVRFASVFLYGFSWGCLFRLFPTFELTFCMWCRLFPHFRTHVLYVASSFSSLSNSRFVCGFVLFLCLGCAFCCLEGCMESGVVFRLSLLLSSLFGHASSSSCIRIAYVMKRFWERFETVYF